MAPTKFRVLVIGGGIGGLSLGLMLERAGIDYTILEAQSEIRPLGATMCLGPPVMNALQQLGIIDDVARNAIPLQGLTLMDEHLQRLCRIDLQFHKERYGYLHLNILRPALYEILMSKIPAYKLLYDKRVIHVAQNDEGVLVRCLDGSTFSGDIVVGADGGESIVRELMYAELRPKGKLPFQDQQPPKVEHQCLVGITNPLPPEKYPSLQSDMCEIYMAMAKHERTLIWISPMAGHRFGWGIQSAVSVVPQRRARDDGTGGTCGGGRGKSTTSSSGGDKALGTRSSVESMQSMSSPISPSSLPASIPSVAMTVTVVGPSSGAAMAAAALSSHTEAATKKERMWQQLDDIDSMIDADTREQPLPIGGTMNDLLDVTPRSMTSRVVTDEKLYHTWHHGRTVLIGDACHRMIVSSGYSPTLAILDAIELSSLLSELPTNEQKDIDKLFRIYFERRSPNVRAAMAASQRHEVLMNNRGSSGKWARKFTNNIISDWMVGFLVDPVYETRPQLTFLKPLPEQGHRKNKALKTQIPLLADRRFESDSSGSSNNPIGSGSGSNGPSSATMASASAFSGSTASSGDSLKSAGSGGNGGIGRRGRQLAMGIVGRIIGSGGHGSSSTKDRDGNSSNNSTSHYISDYGGYYGIEYDSMPNASSKPQLPQQQQKQQTASPTPTPPKIPLSVYTASRFEPDASVLAGSRMRPIEKRHNRSRSSSGDGIGQEARSHKTTSIAVPDHFDATSHYTTAGSNGFDTTSRSGSSMLLPEDEFEELDDDWNASRYQTYEDRLQRHRRHRSRPPPRRRLEGEGEDIGGRELGLDDHLLYNWSSGPRSAGPEGLGAPFSFSVESNDKDKYDFHDDDDNDTNSNSSGFVTTGGRTSKLLRPFLSSLPMRRGIRSSNQDVSSSSFGSTHSGSHISAHSASQRGASSAAANPSTSLVAPPLFDFYLPQNHQDSQPSKLPHPLIRARSD